MNIYELSRLLFVLLVSGTLMTTSIVLLVVVLAIYRDRKL